MQLSDVPAAAENQNGTFTRDQARRAGVTTRQIRRRLAARRWKVVAGEALAPTGQAIGPPQLAFAVVLTWPSAVVSHELAGALHQFPLVFNGLGTSTVRQTLSVRANGLCAHRLPLTAQETCDGGGFPITTAERTALDLLRTLPWSQCRSLWAWLGTRGVLSLSDIEAELTRRERRLGSGQLRKLIDVSATGSLSAAEDILHDVLRCALISGWRPNAAVEVGGRVVAVVDALFDAARLVIEVDGYAAHSTPQAFQRDRERQNLLVAAGYQVLRFTWMDLNRRPEVVLSSIRAALTRAA